MSPAIARQYNYLNQAFLVHQHNVPVWTNRT